MTGQAFAEIIQHFAQTGEAGFISLGGSDVMVGPGRRHHAHQILDGIEYGDDGRAHELAVRHVQGFRVGIGNIFGQAHRVITHIAEQTGRHGWQSGRQLDTGFGQYGPERRQCAGGFGNRAGLEGARVRQRMPVDIGLVAVAAPDQIGLHAQKGIAPPDRAAFHRFQKKAVGGAADQFDHGRYRRLQIGDHACP